VRASDHDVRAARRIVLWGVTGSGKTTLGRAAAGRLAVPFVDGDVIGWLPGWVQRDEAEQRRIVAERVADDAWVIDTAWGVWRDLVLPRADLVVALDFSRRVSLGRLVRRTVARNVDGREICNGNVETWRQTFSRDSILLWHFRTFAEKRATIREWEQDPQMPPVLRLTTPSAAERWLASLRRDSPGAPSLGSR
jgi:adenylate kinase family enzyme